MFDGASGAAFIGVLVSVGFQVLKDHVNLSPNSIRWVAAAMGAVIGGSAGLAGGDETVKALLQNSSIAAAIGPGIHGLLLKDSRIGGILKAIGAVVFENVLKVEKKTTP